MSHTLSHSLKLAFSRTKWVLQALLDAEVHNKLIQSKDRLATLQHQIHELYLINERQNPASRETILLEGKLSILNELINGSRQEGQEKSLDGRAN